MSLKVTYTHYNFTLLFQFISPSLVEFKDTMLKKNGTREVKLNLYKPRIMTPLSYFIILHIPFHHLTHQK